MLGLDSKAMAVFSLQILLIVMLLFGFAKFYFNWSLLIFFSVQGLLSLCFLGLVYTVVKKDKKEALPFLVFFVPLLVLVQASLALNFFITGFVLQSQLVLLIIVLLLFFVLVFRLALGRNYTAGTILLCDKRHAVVKTEFDLLSFTNAGKYAVKTDKQYKKGEKVKVNVKSTLFSRKPEKIVGKV